VDLYCDLVATISKVHKNEIDNPSTSMYLTDKDGKMKKEPTKFVFVYYFELDDSEPCWY
jgi:hypothetical protein